MVDQIQAVDKIQPAPTSTGHGKKISPFNFCRCLRKATSTDGENKNTSVDDLYQGLQKVIQDLEFIKKEVIEFKEETMRTKDDQMHISYYSVPSVATAGGGSLRRSPSSTGKNTMVGFDDLLIEVMSKLTRQKSIRQIISIVGMGGMGKTTLATSIYVNPLIVQHFDFRGWATISQEYKSKEILLEVLVCLKTIGNRESSGQLNQQELGDTLYKSLFGRRYLIVMDDIWSIEAWDEVKIFFPDNNDGSAIILTTRLSNLAFQLSGCSDNVLKMKFLDEDNSWGLFCKIVFGDEGYPLDLEEIGKKIVKSCKGLPLSITVVGGLLSKYKQLREYWEYILENLNPILNLEDNEYCLKILRMSYKELPAHLKPCFLYMGAFPEDREILVSRVIKLWVAEGFLKPISSKSLEVVAEEYLQDLVDRNLIFVHILGSRGNIKYCKIHDLLRDLCFKEAHKDKFLCFKRPHDGKIPQDIQNQRRVSFHLNMRGELIGTLQSASLRSLICDFGNQTRRLPVLSCRLLRVLKAPGVLYHHHEEEYCPETKFQLVNSRFLEIISYRFPPIPSSDRWIWNLQTLIVRSRGVYGRPPFEILKMPQLRHVDISFLELPDPPMEYGFVTLENLQSLSLVNNFKCGEELVKRIPNIKKLGIYNQLVPGTFSPNYINNFSRLRKLESLSCTFAPLDNQCQRGLLQRLKFPNSLKKLTLSSTNLHWEEMTMTNIGSLPHLQVLKLRPSAFEGAEWETIEGEFLSLKYLEISCRDFEYWRTESTHFPCLERLVLRSLDKLKEIPLEVGDITTLKSIELNYCSNLAVVSARKILKEQEDLGNVDLQVVVVDL